MNKNIFIFDIDDTIIESTQWLVNNYNINHPDDLLIKNDFQFYLNASKLVPKYYEDFRKLIDTLINDCPNDVKLVEGFYEFYKNFKNKNNHYLFLSKRKNINNLRKYFSSKGIKIDNIIFVTNVDDKIEYILDIFLFNRYNNVLIFEDNPVVIKDCFTYLTEFNYIVFIKKQPWNNNVIYNFENYKDFKYFDNYFELFELIENFLGLTNSFWKQ